MHLLTLWAGSGNFPMIAGYAKVDDALHLQLSRFHYFLDSKGYAARTEKKRKKIYLHQDVMRISHPEIWPIPKHMEIDHENRDTLDNQIDNLRVVTLSVNRANKNKRADNTSGFVGVSLHNQNQKWVAEIWANGQKIYLGIFDDILDAAKKVNDAYAYYFPTVKAPNDIPLPSYSNSTR